MPYKDKNRRLEAQRRYSSERRRRFRDFLNDYKSKIGCSFCGEDEPCCLCFHHLKDKTESVSILVCRASMEKIIEEIRKCIVVCHNCHARIHAGLIDT
jgi:hypothetical protein